MSDDGEAPQSGARSKRKTIILLAALASVVAAGAAGGALFGERILQSASLVGSSTSSAEEENILIAVPEILTNLSTTGASKHIRLNVSLSIPASARQGVEDVMPEITASYVEYLRNVDETELSGSIGIYQLRQALIKRARIVAGANSVRDVLIQELLTQ